MTGIEEKQGLAVVTGASSGIGLELARLCAADGFDLVICANEDAIARAAAELRAQGVGVEAVQADLAAEAGVQQLWAHLQGRRIEVLIANAGTGVGGPFLDEEWSSQRRVIDLNVNATCMLVHLVGRRMRQQGAGRILLTGSIAGRIPGAFNAIYNASKAFLELFAYALRNEMKETGVTVTCLMPGPTDTEFFDRAGMGDSPMAQDAVTGDPAKVARDGYEAMMRGQGGVTSGFINKVQALFAEIIPDSMLAKMHRRVAVSEADRRQGGKDGSSD